MSTADASLQIEQNIASWKTSHSLPFVQLFWNVCDLVFLWFLLGSCPSSLLLTYLCLVPLLGHRLPTRVLQLSLSWAFLSSWLQVSPNLLMSASKSRLCGNLESLSCCIHHSYVPSSHPDSSFSEKGVRPCSFQIHPAFTAKRHPFSLWWSSSPKSWGNLGHSCMCFCSKQMFYRVRLLASRPTLLLSHPGLGPAMAIFIIPHFLSRD